MFYIKEESLFKDIFFYLNNFYLEEKFLKGLIFDFCEGFILGIYFFVMTVYLTE